MPVLMCGWHPANPITHECRHCFEHFCREDMATVEPYSSPSPAELWQFGVCNACIGGVEE